MFHTRQKISAIINIKHYFYISPLYTHINTINLVAVITVNVYYHYPSKIVQCIIMGFNNLDNAHNKQLFETRR